MSRKSVAFARKLAQAGGPEAIHKLIPSARVHGTGRMRLRVCEAGHDGYWRVTKTHDYGTPGVRPCTEPMRKEKAAALLARFGAKGGATSRAA